MSSVTVSTGELGIVFCVEQDRQESGSHCSITELDIVCAVSGVLAKLYQTALGDVFCADGDRTMCEKKISSSTTDHHCTQRDS